MSHALLALAVSALLAQEQAAAPDPLAKLVPAGTVACVRAASLEKLDTLMRRAFAALEPARLEAFDIDAMLVAAGLPGSPKKVDHGRPIQICFVIPERGPPVPTPTFLVPTSSPESFLRSVRASGVRVMTAVEGDYVSVSLAPGSMPGTSPEAIGLDLPTGDLVARIDVERLVGRLRPAIEASFAQLDSAGPLAKWMKSIVDSSRRLDVVASLEGDRFELAPALTVLEDSPLAAIGSKGSTGVRSLARFLDPDAWIGALVGMDSSTLTKGLLPLVHEALALDPDPARSIFRKLMARMPEIAEAAGSAACLGTDIRDGSLRGSCYLRAVDSARLVALCDAAIRDVPGTSPDAPTDAEIDGARARRLRIRVNTAAFVDALAGLDEKQKADLKALYGRIYGENGLALTLATKEGVTAMVLGGDEAFLRACLARIPGGNEPPPAVARALAQVGDLEPCFVAQYDAGRVMHGMNALIGGTLPDWPFAFPETSATFTAWGGVDRLVWRGAISMDLAQLEASFHRMQAAAKANPTLILKADIDAITAALIEYASWHRGQFPPTLTPLLSPNVDRYVYLDLAEIPKDPWGREYLYDPPSAAAKDPRVYTYGKDGKPGGEGEDADIEVWIRKGKGR